MIDECAPSALSQGQGTGRESTEHDTSRLGRLLPRGVKATVAFMSYWRLAAERQSIFFKRLQQEPAPWTADPVLLKHKFTNAYRAIDRVSQYLIRHVIYEGEQSPVEWFFRILLFKFFNSISTWELLTSSLGELHSESFSVEASNKVLTEAMDAGRPIYSAAYIMPSGGRSSPYRRKHEMHLALLAQMLIDRVPDQITTARDMGAAFRVLRKHPTIGDFLAYQFVTDLNYSPLTTFSEMEFVCPGPGAADGIRKCFSDQGHYCDEDLIKMVTDNQEHMFSQLGIHFEDLWGRRLQLIDCQNLFCEVDKYARVAHPELTPHKGRAVIKQRFHPSPAPLHPWFPPKWGLNQLVSAPHS